MSALRLAFLVTAGALAFVVLRAFDHGAGRGVGDGNGGSSRSGPVAAVIAASSGVATVGRLRAVAASSSSAATAAITAVVIAAVGRFCAVAASPGGAVIATAVAVAASSGIASARPAGAGTSGLLDRLGTAERTRRSLE